MSFFHRKIQRYHRDPRARSNARRDPEPVLVGRAGFFASIAMAFCGIAIGATCVYIGGKGAQVRAAKQTHQLPLRDAEHFSPATAFSTRARYVNQIIGAAAGDRIAPSNEQRLQPPIIFSDTPKIILIFDDMGVSQTSFDTIMSFPGPVTFSFLPYANNVQQMADRASARGDAVMLHLPMEPVGNADPGPDSLNANMSRSQILKTLDKNLGRFSGYIGVNNHMGSAFTADRSRMKTVLGALKREDLFFLDSLTTSKSVVQNVGQRIGIPIFQRDVFLDPDLDSKTIFKQLELVERIAKETGFAVAICHPRKNTIDVIGPWLTSAPARGFELATITALQEADEKLRTKEIGPIAIRG